jgi:AcrR family transcriptional regulator
MGRPKTIEDDALLKIAREVFLEGGAYGSTKEIAARAGISEAALFKRFPTKAVLFLKAMAPPPADAGYILKQVRAEKDPKKALRVLARQMLAYYRTALPRVVHLITHPAIGIDALPAHLGGDGVMLDAAIAAYLREEHMRGRINAPDARAAAAILVATLHSVVMFELMGVHGGAIPPQAIEAMLDALWNGFEPRKAFSPRRRKT